MDKIKLKVLIKRAILDGIKYHYEMAELGRGSNFDQFAEDRVKDFESVYEATVCLRVNQCQFGNTVQCDPKECNIYKPKQTES